MLSVQNLAAGYGGKAVLRDVSIEARAGEIVTIIGANGAGKSTLINAVSGVLVPTEGVIKFDGEAVNGLPSHRIARRGLIQVPEGRQVFAPLTVKENLELGFEALGKRAKAGRDDFDQ